MPVESVTWIAWPPVGKEGIAATFATGVNTADVLIAVIALLALASADAATDEADAAVDDALFAVETAAALWLSAVLL